MLDMGGYGCGARWFLDRAIRYGNVDLAAWCLEHGAGPNVPPARAKRMLQTRNCARLPNLCSEPPTRIATTSFVSSSMRGFSPNVADDKNTRALNHTAWSDAIDAARALVERGAEIDSVEHNYGGTPFGNASHFLHKRVMDFLAPLTKDVWNLTYNGYLDRLREGLAEDLGRARADRDTWSPLLWLPPHDEDVALEIVKLCVHYGADPRRRDSNGIARVDRAEALGMTRVVAYLRGLGRQE